MAEAAITVHRPGSVKELEEIMRGALAACTNLELVGGGTKRALGRAGGARETLSFSALSGIVSYEPEELVLTARAGTPLSYLAGVLGAKRQMLAFEPPDFRVLLGSKGEATLGGVVACGYSGPRRVKSGAVRDHILGVEAVSGRAERFIAGGRVVKNVTGYDLPKLFTGSFGTLCALSEITVKVLPAPESELTLAFRGLEDERGIQCLLKAMQSPCDVSGAAHFAGNSVIRLEGIASALDARAVQLEQELSDFGAASRIGRDESRVIWSRARDVAPFNNKPIVWRLSVMGSKAAACMAAIRTHVEAAEAFYDWAGALLWIALPGPDAHEAVMREQAKLAGGHAMLFKAPQTLRETAEVFPPLDERLMKLTASVKAQFDPTGMLNPGRMYQSV